MKSLEQVQQEWLSSYFTEVASIWDAWQHKEISMRERDQTLQWYRQKLWELREAKRREQILQSRPKPRSEDGWIAELRIERLE